MRITLFLALASFLAGCGGSTASIGGGSDSGSGCSGTQPSCTICGDPTSPSCIDGAWECPVFGIECPYDAGTASDGGCGGAQPSCTFCGEPTSPSCIGGTWECPVFGIMCPYDAGGGTGDASFECYGTKTCNADTQYCNVTGGGVVPLDGGSNLTVSCEPLPATTCDAGTGCACIPDRCSCTEEAGAITNECFFP